MMDKHTFLCMEIEVIKQMLDNGEVDDGHKCPSAWVPWLKDFEDKGYFVLRWISYDRVAFVGFGEVGRKRFFDDTGNIHPNYRLLSENK